MQITGREAEVLRLVGSDLFRRAVGYARAGAVTGVQVTDDGDTLRAQVRGRAARPYTTKVYLTREPGRGVVDFLGICTCPVGADCKHAVALMLTDAGTPDRRDVGPAWRAAFDGLLPGRVVPQQAPVALQFARRDGSVTIRPVLPGANGDWVRSGISWTDLDQLQWSTAPRATGHFRLLAELSALYTVAQSEFGHYHRQPSVLGLHEFSRRVWDVLAEAQADGMPFVAARAADGPVVLHDRPVTIALDVRADAHAEGGAVVEPRVTFGEATMPVESVLFLGAPAHGAAWLGEKGLQLARLEAPGVDVRELVDVGPVRVPPAEMDRFLGSYAMPLQNSVPLVSSDSSVGLPELGEPTLVLAAAHSAGRLQLSWCWRYGAGRFELVVPFGTQPAGGRLRDLGAERAVSDAAVAACSVLPALVTGARLAASATLTGTDLVTFAEQVRPALDDVRGVRIEFGGDEFDVHQAVTPPQIDFVAADTAGASARDWLDLAVTVRIDGESVPFADLFSALAADERVMLLPSGTWFALDRPELVQLAALIAESRKLYDGEADSLRVGRYQASVCNDLDRLGAVHGQAVEWHAAVRAVLASTAAGPGEAPSVPSGLAATLRPYQQVGFGWLAGLFDHGLGGILADEMGLGKTIQCLALFCHARERAPAGPPFLVVAPTSVVSNWADEAARFAPALRVAAITGMLRRRQRSVADLASGADVVITSYARFRIDQQEYRQVGWAGLILDEAQFVKNHRSQAFACAKALPTPFKLAITGTPMENNLSELWALFAIAAPGLFPNAKSFDDYYRVPIERGRNTELLAQLRRRMRPFLLRRTKAEVVADLPAKQEQVLELDLDPRHRTAYQTLLARERRKVLGLLGDLDRNKFEILRSLTLLRQASLDVSLVDPHYGSVPSTKLDELMRMLAEIAADGHRVVVFSQFTRFLGKVRERLDAAGIAHCYLDGRTRDRGAEISQFKGGDAPVFLISLKAGGFGLNLTEADYCILLDPWWNATAEAQAVDRVHRIGQTRTVNVYRLVARDTIEQKVMAVKEGKAALFASVMDGGDWTGNRLTADEICSLLS